MGILRTAVRFLGTTLVLAVFSGPSHAGSEFPLRAEYTDCETIETESLKTSFATVIPIDVRSQMEFDVFHIKGAKHLELPILNERNLGAIRAKKSNTRLVFYCNGFTCRKSYDAARKARGFGFEDIFVYDAGIETWATEAPEHTMFFGEAQTKESLAKNLIAKAQFESHLLNARDFKKKGLSGEFFLIDTRTPGERESISIQIGQIHTIEMDSLVNLIKVEKVIPRQNLLIIDNVGKEVRWLQYYLERGRIKNYYFLKDGAKGWKDSSLDVKGNSSAPNASL